MTPTLASDFEPKTSRHVSRVAAIALSLIALPLAGCEHEADIGPRVAGWSLIDPAQRHPIIVSQQPEAMDIHVSQASRGLTPAQRSDILAFADRSRAGDAGNSRLVISTPSGGANEVAAMAAVGEIRDILSNQGFSASSIAVEARHATSGRDPIRVSYLRYVAEPPSCGSWPQNLAHDPYNLPYPNFGCSAQHNFAVQVANPADLLGPRTQSDRPGERRGEQWDKYVKGESTAANKTADERINTKSSD